MYIRETEAGGGGSGGDTMLGHPRDRGQATHPDQGLSPR